MSTSVTKKKIGADRMEFVPTKLERLFAPAQLVIAWRRIPPAKV